MEDNTKYIIDKALRRTTGKSVLSLVVKGLTYIVGSIIVANYLGLEAMSIMFIAAPLWIILEILFDNAGATAVSLYGDALAKSDKPLAIRYVSEVFWFTIIFGLTMVGCGMLFASQITSMLGVPEELFAQSENFIFWLFPTIFLAFLPWVLVSIITVDGGANKILIGYIIYFISTAIFTTLFLTLFEMNLLGYLLAVALSGSILIIYSLQHFRSKEYFIRIKWHIPSLPVIKIFLRNLIYYTIDYIGVAAVMIIINRVLLDNFSLELVAISLLIGSMYKDFVCPLTEGVMIAATPLYSVFFGDKNAKGVKLSFLATLRYTMYISVILLILATAFTPYLLQLFNYEYPEYNQMAIWAIRVYSFSIPILIINNATRMLFIYTSHTMLATVVSVISEVVGPLLLFIFVLKTGDINYLWYIYGISAFVALVAAAIYIKIRYKSVSIKSIMEDDANRENSVYYMIHTDRLNEVENYQEMITMFFNNHQVSEQKCSLCHLALGEIVEYALASQQRANSFILIQASLLNSGDVCISVNLDNKIMNVDMIDVNNDDKFLSLKMLRSISKSFEFKHVFTFNSIEVVI